MKVMRSEVSIRRISGGRFRAVLDCGHRVLARERSYSGKRACRDCELDQLEKLFALEPISEARGAQLPLFREREVDPAAEKD